MRILIYARRSQTERKRSRSVSAQQRVALEDVALHGWDCVGVFEDDGISASRHARKARVDWPKVVELLRADKADALWLLDSSRGDRDASRWLELLSFCRERGILIYIHLAGRFYDMSVPNDWKELASQGVENAADSDNKSLKVKLGTEESAREGVHPGGIPPYGYRRVWNEDEDRFDWEVDEQTAPVVADIVARAARRESLYSIRKRLNDAGTPSPRGKAWSDNSVKRVATNEIYIGRRTLNGKTHEGSWPKVADPVAMAAARRFLLTRPEAEPAAVEVREVRAATGRRAGEGSTETVRGKDGTTVVRRKVARPGKAIHFLTLVKCAECGRGLVVNARPGVAAHYVCGAPGRHASVRKDPFDRFIETVIIKRLARPDIFATFDRPDDETVVLARADVVELKARRRAMLREGANGKLKPADLAEVLAEIDEQLVDAQRRAESASVPHVIVELLNGVEGVDQEIREKEIRRVWESREMSTRREIVSLLVEYVRLRPARGRRTGPVGWLDPARVDLRWRGENDQAIVAS